MMNPYRLAARGGSVVGTVFAIGIALAVCGCVTVPDGTHEALEAPNVLLEWAADDQDSEIDERAPGEAKQMLDERDRLFSEMYRDIMLDVAETDYDPEVVRKEFVARGVKVEGDAKAFDSDFKTWAGRAKKRSKVIREAMQMNRTTSDALKAAQAQTTPEVPADGEVKPQ